MVLLSSTHVCVGFRSDIYIHTQQILSEQCSMISHGLQTDVNLQSRNRNLYIPLVTIKVHVVRKCFKALNPQVVSNGPLQFCDPQIQLQTSHVVWLVKLWLNARDTNQTMFT